MVSGVLKDSALVCPTPIIVCEPGVMEVGSVMGALILPLPSAFTEVSCEPDVLSRNTCTASLAWKPVPVTVVPVPGGVEAGLSARLLAMVKDEVVTLELVTPTIAMG